MMCSIDLWMAWSTHGTSTKLLSAMLNRRRAALLFPPSHTSTDFLAKGSALRYSCKWMYARWSCIILQPEPIMWWFTDGQERVSVVPIVFRDPSGSHPWSEKLLPWPMIHPWVYWTQKACSDRWINHVPDRASDSSSLRATVSYRARTLEFVFQITPIICKFAVYLLFVTQEISRTWWYWTLYETNHGHNIDTFAAHTRYSMFENQIVAWCSMR